MQQFFNWHTWDKNTVIATGVLSFISLHLEDVNLLLSILVKLFTFVNIIVYLILNYRRIIIAVKMLLIKRKKKK